MTERLGLAIIIASAISNMPTTPEMLSSAPGKTRPSRSGLWSWWELMVRYSRRSAGSAPSSQATTLKDFSFRVATLISMSSLQPGSLFAATGLPWRRDADMSASSFPVHPRIAAPPRAGPRPGRKGPAGLDGRVAAVITTSGNLSLSGRSKGKPFSVSRVFRSSLMTVTTAAAPRSRKAPARPARSLRFSAGWRGCPSGSVASRMTATLPLTSTAARSSQPSSGALSP